MADKYIGLYAKAISAAVVAGAGAYVSAVQDGPGVTGPELLGIIIAAVVGLGAVWAIPNLPTGVAAYLKAGMGALVAVLSAVAVGWLDGSINASEWTAALVAGLSAAGLVGTVSNAAESDPVVSMGTDKGHLVGVTRAQKANIVTGSE